MLQLNSLKRESEKLRSKIHLMSTINLHTRTSGKIHNLLMKVFNQTVETAS